MFLSNPEVQAGFSVSGDLTFVQAQQPISLTGEGWFARRQARFGHDAAVSDAARAELVVAADARLAWTDAWLGDRRVVLTGDALALAGGSVRLSRRAPRRRAVQARRCEGAGGHGGGRRARRQPGPRRRVRAVGVTTPDAMSIGVAGGADDAIPVATSTAPVRADVDAARTRVEQARSASARAKSAAVPPMAIGVQYQSDGGSVDLGPMLTVALPLWNRNQAGIGSAKGDLAVAEAELAAITARAAAESRLGRAAAEAAVTTAARLDGTDVAAAEGLALVDLAFQKGELDVRDAILLGRLAALDAIHSVTATRLAALLAEGDPALLAR